MKTSVSIKVKEICSDLTLFIVNEKYSSEYQEYHFKNFSKGFRHILEQFGFNWIVPKDVTYSQAIHIIFDNNTTDKNISMRKDV